MNQFRVATLNIWNKSGPWVERTKIIRAEMDRLDADVIGLQEVLELRAGKVTMNQADELRGTYERAYSAAHDVATSWGGDDNQLHFGNAVLSRWPIEAHDSHLLPGSDESDQRRCVIHTRLAAPFGPLDVFVTHLNWKLHEGWIRQKQVAFIVDLIMEVAPVDGRYPPILMGDLNAEPPSDEIRFLGGYTTLGRERTVRFQDVWDYAPAGSSATFDGSRNPFAALVHEPPRRLDYIFVRGPDEKGRGKPSDVRICFDEPEGGVHASDHFGVVTDLTY